METGWVIFLGLVALAGALVFAVRYADRAIREGRPGWTSPPEKKSDPEKGLYCPNAVGIPGEQGPPGREEK